MDELTEDTLGGRERKRAQTFERIARAAIALFVEKGYEQTTLDDIAAAAGISRRTFFYYYKSKDDILVALQCEGFNRALTHAFDDLPPGTTPFMAVRDRLPNLVSSFENEETVVISRIMKSTEALRVRKQAGYVEMEDILLAALSRVFPNPEDQPGLILIATTTISILRLALDKWLADGGHVGSLAKDIRESFALLERQF